MRKLMNKKLNKKGFTLMEMLIVVAIIAILVAIAIPTFSKSLNAARASADAANIRAGYATLQTGLMMNDYTLSTTADTEFYLQKDGSVSTADTDSYVCQGKDDDLSGDKKIAGMTVDWAKGNKIVYTVDKTSGALKKIAGK